MNKILALTFCAATLVPLGCSNNEKAATDNTATKPAEEKAADKKAPAAPAANVADALKAPPDVAAAPADAEKTASGLAYKVLKKGTGTAHPTAMSSVEVHYTGWKTNGEMFDSSVKRGKSISFGLNRVIKGWTEGVQLMVVGEKARFWIPANLAYGENPGGGRPGGLLVFDIELLGIK